MSTAVVRHASSSLHSPGTKRATRNNPRIDVQLIRLSEGGTPAIPGEQRSEVDIIVSLAERILPVKRFECSTLRSHAQLRHAIAQVVPGYAPIRDIDHTRQEFYVQGRTFHTPQFSTTTGKAVFHVTPIPTFAPGPNEFRLMTFRSENQFNTVVYGQDDLYRGNQRRDVVMMAAEDARRLGLNEGSPLVVEITSFFSISSHLGLNTCCVQIFACL